MSLLSLTSFKPWAIQSSIIYNYNTKQLLIKGLKFGQFSNARIKVMLKLEVVTYIKNDNLQNNPEAYPKFVLLPYS